MKRTVRLSCGFTLVELLVVVAILSATAVAAFGLMTEDRVQVRIDDTRNRLTLLRRAVLGLDSPAWGGEVRLSGYVADNGVLPATLRDLLTVPENYGEQAGIDPVFSDAISDECLSLGTDTPLGPPARLLKGHRGNYLAGAARNGEFRDGWGNVGQGADDNFGWDLNDDVADSLTVTSLGADNLPGSATGVPMEADVSMTITPDDWHVPLDGWQVTIKNVSTGSLNGVPGLALLVYENTNTGRRWRQFRNTDSDCLSSLPIGESCLLSFAADTDGKIACDTATNTIPARVPLGRHVLVLTLGNALPADHRTVAQIDFHPGTHQPNLTLEIR
jgi:prepilin-type N-terminal cleavage/methylation domain-containing protein